MPTVQKEINALMDEIITLTHEAIDIAQQKRARETDLLILAIREHDYGLLQLNRKAIAQREREIRFGEK